MAGLTRNVEVHDELARVLAVKDRREHLAVSTEHELARWIPWKSQ
jgi:hypothetical protein